MGRRKKKILVEYWRIHLNTAIILGVSLAVAIPLCVIKKIPSNVITLLCKIFAVALFLTGSFRMFLNDNFIWIINGGNYGDFYYKSQDIGQSVLRWLTYISLIVCPCAIFTKLRTVRNFAVYFCVPVSIVASFFYNDFMHYFLTPSGRGFWVDESIRHIQFSLELILPIVLGALIRFRMGHKFDYKSGREWKYFSILLPIMLVGVIPVYLPQSIFGFTKYRMGAFSVQHLVWLALLIGITLTLYFTLRFQPYEQRFGVCVFLALYLVMHYNSIYMMDMKLSRLPLQLCNLGAYLALLALIIRKQGFYNFIFLANTPGTIIALFAPEVKEGMLSFWNIHFYIEHMLVFILPILFVSLRLMKRPDKKAIKHFFIGFSIYFIICAVMGSLFNGYLYEPYNFFKDEVNYFYMFDDTVVSIFFFLKFVYEWPVFINGYVIYPLYMIMIYI